MNKNMRLITLMNKDSEGYYDSKYNIGSWGDIYAQIITDAPNDLIEKTLDDHRFIDLENEDYPDLDDILYELGKAIKQAGFKTINIAGKEFDMTLVEE